MHQLREWVMDARYRDVFRRPLRWLVTGLVVVAGTGMLLGVPPFSIWPLHAYVSLFHRWTGVALALPALLAILAHGIPAWRRSGLRSWTRSGLLLGLSLFPTSFTGALLVWAPEIPPWYLLAHIGSGMTTLVFTMMHGLRTAPLKRRRAGL